MSVSVTQTAVASALPQTDEVIGFPVGMIEHTAVLAGDASGGTAIITVNLPYGVAIQPILVHGAWQTAAAASQHWQWFLGRFTGTREDRIGQFEDAPVTVFGGFGGMFTETIPAFVYLPNEELVNSVPATHAVILTVANVAASTLTLHFRALVFDPANVKRGPMAALAFFLLH